MTQFTCPKCGAIGADDIVNPKEPPLYLPLCHKCNTRVTMRISDNGIISENRKDDEIKFMRNQIEEAKNCLVCSAIADSFEVCVNTLNILEDDYFKSLFKEK